MTNETILQVLQNASGNINFPILDGIIFYNYTSEFLNIFNAIIKNIEFFIDGKNQDAILVKFSDVNKLTEFILTLENQNVSTSAYQLTIIGQTYEGLENV